MPASDDFNKLAESFERAKVYVLEKLPKTRGKAHVIWGFYNCWRDVARISRYEDDHPFISSPEFMDETYDPRLAHYCIRAIWEIISESASPSIYRPKNEKLEELDVEGLSKLVDDLLVERISEIFRQQEIRGVGLMRIKRIQKKVKELECLKEAVRAYVENDYYLLGAYLAVLGSQQWGPIHIGRMLEYARNE
jgi:hypothetical protein